LEWSGLEHHQIDLLIVTSTEEAAENASEWLGRYRWRSLTIRIHRRLHAKLYAFSSERGAAISLVGSQNLTDGGAHNNLEAGVLVMGSADAGARAWADACRRHVEAVARESQPYESRTHNCLVAAA
jgi:phosphatidylserine/phosphatidylglycerophosphate/cardiolipin synthase-like enzyme